MRKPRFVSCALVLVLALGAVFPVKAAAVNTSATAAVLMDADSGRVLYAQNEDARMLIASTTKILTALVAIECGRLSDVITVSKEAALTEGSAMYLKEGEQLTLETLLYGLLLSSGNDAAVAVAEGVAGNVESFVAMMNEKAASFGATGTHFTNPSGLTDEFHYTTPYDMALIGRACFNNKTLMNIIS